MRTITRTIYGSALQTAMLLKLPYTVVPNTTLNEKFGILANQVPEPGKLPSLAYFCIGNGGHRSVTGADGIPYTMPIKHRASDAALFNHLPFVLREVNDDLPPEQRQKYALRREEQHGGRRYYAYYLKRLDLSGVVNEMKHTTVIDGVSQTLPFIPTSANLNPTPPEISPTGINPTEGDYLTTTAVVEIRFTANDVAELVRVAEILYGNELMAVISEIGLCSGLDKVITAQGPGNTTFNFNEAIAVQITNHITSYYSMAYTNNGFDFQIEMGATEPLLGGTGA